MKTIFCAIPVMVFLIGVALSAAPAVGADVSVVEATKAGGITELRVIAPNGGMVRKYEVDTAKHHSPAADRSGIGNWESLKFGGFVCFNTNQFTGEEFCHARDPRAYNPTNLNVAGWVDSMSKAGMRYAILTTRHTSGFLLWDSATSDFNILASGNKTDVVKEFVGCCRKNKIVPGLYYCMWGGASNKSNPNARAIILAQLYELARNYGEIQYFWIDMMNWAPKDFSAQEVYDVIKNLQPNAVVALNQHIQDGTKIQYFPTDVLNGEETLPPASGHKPGRKVGNASYYLPFEYEPVSQQRSEVKTGAKKGCWFTYGEGKSFEPSKPIAPEVLAKSIKEAYRRGASNVLLSMAPDFSGSMREGDVQQLTEIGKLIKPIIGERR